MIFSDEVSMQISDAIPAKISSISNKIHPMVFSIANKYKSKRTIVANITISNITQQKLNTPMSRNWVDIKHKKSMEAKS